MLIDISNPQQTSPGEYKYTLSGLIDCECITTRKSPEEALQAAKEVVASYLKRMELSATLEAILKGEKPPEKIELKSEWTGIVFDVNRSKWKVTSYRASEKHYGGHHVTLGNAIVAKRKLNLSLGLPEFRGYKG